MGIQLPKQLQISNESCLKLLPTIPTESIDLVIVDPPYYKILKEKWDQQWANEKEYLDWCQQWTAECVRVLKQKGCLYVWGTTKTDTFLRYKLEVLNSFKDLQYQSWVIWSYDWGGRSKKNFARKHEDLLMYSKSKEFIFHGDAIRIPYKMKKNVRATAKNNPLGKLPTDVWEMNNHTASKEYCRWHPTQKPVRLLERIIRAHTKPEDTVLDCFSGSGSTAVACKKLDRNFIGCELDQNYYEKSLERLRADKERLWRIERRGGRGIPNDDNKD